MLNLIVFIYVKSRKILTFKRNIDKQTYMISLQKGTKKWF